MHTEAALRGAGRAGLAEPYHLDVAAAIVEFGERHRSSRRTRRSRCSRSYAMPVSADFRRLWYCTVITALEGGGRSSIADAYLAHALRALSRRPGDPAAVGDRARRCAPRTASSPPATATGARRSEKPRSTTARSLALAPGSARNAAAPRTRAAAARSAERSARAADAADRRPTGRAARVSRRRSSSAAWKTRPATSRRGRYAGTTRAPRATAVGQAARLGGQRAAAPRRRTPAPRPRRAAPRSAPTTSSIRGGPTSSASTGASTSSSTALRKMSRS